MCLSLEDFYVLTFNLNIKLNIQTHGWQESSKLQNASILPLKISTDLGGKMNLSSKAL